MRPVRVVERVLALPQVVGWWLVGGGYVLTWLIRMVIVVMADICLLYWYHLGYLFGHTHTH